MLTDLKEINIYMALKMKYWILPLAGVLCATTLCAKNYDIVVVGGTPGGIMTAVAAAREGKSVAILERTSHIGGLPANGLGATDIATRNATTGLFREFTKRVNK